MVKINKAVVENIPILLPPLPEQKAIADILSTWDEAIDKTERLIQAKEKRFNSLHQYFFSQKTSQNSLWRKVKIGKLLISRNEKAIPTEQLNLYSLTIENGITAKTDRYNREALVKDAGSKKYKIVCPDDIVFNPANLRWGAIARSNVSNDVVVSPIYEVLRIKDNAVDIDFLAHILTCSRQIRIYASKTEGTLIERLEVKLNTFLLMDIYIPENRIEQQQIAKILNAAQRETTTLKTLLEKYKLQKRGLMQKILVGTWRMREEIINKYETID